MPLIPASAGNGGETMDGGRVESIMTTDVASVAPDCPLREVVAKMRDQRISCLVVC